VLSELLARIVRDESRHFSFYFRQAERWLQSSTAARVTRFLIENFWAPVGSGVQPRQETRFIASYVLSGSDGRAAAQRIDDTIRRLPGLQGIALLGAWLDRELPLEPAPPAIGTRAHFPPGRLQRRSVQDFGGLRAVRPSTGIVG